MSSNRFIQLTSDLEPVIIGINSIAMVKKADDGCIITFNFARGNDTYPKKIRVSESWDKVQSLLEPNK